MIRVAQVITSVVLGGGGQVMSAFARNIDRSAFEMDIYCVLEGGELVDYIRSLGFRLEVLPLCRERGLMRYDARLWLRLARMLRRGGYDVVHTHLFRADLTGTLAALAARRPVIVKTLHNMGTRKRRYHRIVDALLEPWTDRIVCVSATQHRACVERDGVQPSRLVTIPNGVQMERFEAPVSRAAVAAEFGLDPARPIVGTVGRLIEEKGHAFLVRAIPAIRRQVPGTQFLVVGDGSLRGMLESMLRDLDAIEGTAITGLRADIPRLLGAMDAFVFPSLSEGSPIAALEAMAAGVPVACSDIPQLLEIVRDGDSALVFPIRNEARLAEAVCRLLLDRNLAATLTRRARDVVRRDYSEATMIRAYEALYRREVAASAR